MKFCKSVVLLGFLLIPLVESVSKPSFRKPAGCFRQCRKVTNEKPVCGTDGVTYPDACDVFYVQRCHGKSVRISHRGPCAIESCRTDCSRVSRKAQKVCANNGKTYINFCEYFNAHKCSDKRIEKIHFGECRGEGECETRICPFIFAPVCGSDGETYSNQCNLDWQKRCEDKDLTVAYEGACRDESDDCLNQACTQEYAPVCGTDGNTYSNECMLKVAACVTDGLRKLHSGPCPRIA